MRLNLRQQLQQQQQQKQGPRHLTNFCFENYLHEKLTTTKIEKELKNQNSNILLKLLTEVWIRRYSVKVVSNLCRFTPQHTGHSYSAAPKCRYGMSCNVNKKLSKQLFIQPSVSIYSLVKSNFWLQPTHDMGLLCRKNNSLNSVVNFGIAAAWKQILWLISIVFFSWRLKV